MDRRSLRSGRGPWEGLTYAATFGWERPVPAAEGRLVSIKAQPPNVSGKTAPDIDKTQICVVANSEAPLRVWLADLDAQDGEIRTITGAAWSRVSSAVVRADAAAARRWSSFFRELHASHDASRRLEFSTPGPSAPPIKRGAVVIGRERRFPWARNDWSASGIESARHA